MKKTIATITLSIFTFVVLSFLFNVSAAPWNTPKFSEDFCRGKYKSASAKTTCKNAYVCGFNNPSNLNACRSASSGFPGRTLGTWMNDQNSETNKALMAGSAKYKQLTKKSKPKENKNDSSGGGGSSSGGSSSSSTTPSGGTKKKNDKQKELSEKDLQVTMPDKAKSGNGYVCGNSKKDKDGTVKTYINLGCKGDAYEGPGGAIGDMAFAIIRFLSIGVGVVIAVSIIISGIQYSTSEGNPETTMQAKSRIQWSIISLVIYVFIFAIANFLIPGGFF